MPGGTSDWANEYYTRKGTNNDTTPTVVYDLQEDDILLGRGNGVNYRPGNIRLRELCHPRSLDFANATTRMEKYRIIQDILDALQATNSRFLKPTTTTTGKKGWEVVDMRTIVGKVKQVLRDRALLIKASGNDSTKEMPRREANYERTSRRGNTDKGRKIPHSMDAAYQKPESRIGSDDGNRTYTRHSSPTVARASWSDDPNGDVRGTAAALLYERRAVGQNRFRLPDASVRRGDHDSSIEEPFSSRFANAYSGRASSILGQHRLVSEAANSRRRLLDDDEVTWVNDLLESRRQERKRRRLLVEVSARRSPTSRSFLFGRDPVDDMSDASPARATRETEMEPTRNPAGGYLLDQRGRTYDDDRKMSSRELERSYEGSERDYDRLERTDETHTRRDPTSLLGYTSARRMAELATRMLGGRMGSVVHPSQEDEMDEPPNQRVENSTSSSSRHTKRSGPTANRGGAESLLADAIRGDRLDETIRSLLAASAQSSNESTIHKEEDDAASTNLQEQLLRELQARRQQTDELIALVRQKDSSLLSAVQAVEQQERAPRNAEDRNNASEAETATDRNRPDTAGEAPYRSSLQTTTFRSLFEDTPRQAMAAQQTQATIQNDTRKPAPPSVPTASPSRSLFRRKQQGQSKALSNSGDPPATDSRAPAPGRSLFRKQGR